MRGYEGKEREGEQGHLSGAFSFFADASLGPRLWTLRTSRRFCNLHTDTPVVSREMFSSCPCYSTLCLS